ncbi:transposase [Desulfarculales bacterium]
MYAGELLALGLGLQPPWRLVGQCVDTNKQPHEVFFGGCRRPGSRVPLPGV